MGARAVDTGALAAQIAGLTLVTEGFTAQARKLAFARLGAMGLPHPRDEYWRYTSPASLSGDGITGETVASATLFEGQSPLRIVFQDGRFDAAASDDLIGEGVQIAPLSAAMGSDLHWAQDVYGALEAGGQTPVPRPFAAMNTAFAQDGILLRVTGKVARPISLIYRMSSISCDAMLHHCIKMDAGAEATILEQGNLGARGNITAEFDLAQGASLHHIRAQLDGSGKSAICHIFARLETDARLKSFTLSARGDLIRNETFIELSGEHGAAHVAGANLIGTGDHHDDTVFIAHLGRACESRQVFKNVLKSGSVGVFQGKILVRQTAQKTDGYQISQSLLLDDDAQFLAKPELEIYADDVKCSHGSTSGALDAEALFYLQSRGVPQDQAQALLVQAFLGAAMDEIANPDLADELREVTAALLAQKDG